MPQPTVMVIGEFFIDEVFSGFDTFPKLGEESFAQTFHREVGGGAAITACGLARLGVSVGVMGAVGKKDGAWVIDRLTACGVDCSGLRMHPTEPTGITVSASTREDRAFLTYYGANAALERVLRAAKTAELLQAVQHIHFACAPDPEDDAKLFYELHRNRRRISIDVQSHVSWLTKPTSVNILRCCDVFFPNEREGGWIAAANDPHEILIRLRDKGLNGVAMKLGGKGAALLWERRQFLTDAYPAKTIDTTGAGDCFDAGFIFAWLGGKKPQRCLEIANICGALSTRALGGLAGFPALEELTDCVAKLDQHKNKGKRP